MKSRTRVVILIAVLASMMAIPLVSLAASPPVSITPVADTYANSGAAGTNYGSSSSLASGSGAISYLRFVVPATPADQFISSATLTVRTTTLSSAGSPGVQTVREGSDAWTETGLTWTNRPAVGSTVLGTFSITTANTAKVVSLSPEVVATLAGRTVTLTITSTSTDTLWLWSRHSTAGPPTLKLAYETRTAPTPTPSEPSSTPTETATAAVPSATETASTAAPSATETATTTPGPTASTTSSTSTGVRNLAFGDSIVEGCCGTTTGATISHVWASALGWAPPVVKGSGGTGYLTGGSVAGRVPYTERIGPVLDANPGLEVLVIQGGGNDPDNDLVAFRNAVRTTFSIAKQKAPQTRIYVVGPYSPNGSGYATKRTVIAEEAAAAGLPYIDPIEWMKGWPDRLWTDGFHPNGAGHAMLGRRVAGELALAGAPVAK